MRWWFLSMGVVVGLMGGLVGGHLLPKQEPEPEYRWLVVVECDQDLGKSEAHYEGKHGRFTRTTYRFKSKEEASEAGAAAFNGAGAVYLRSIQQ